MSLTVGEGLRSNSVVLLLPGTKVSRHSDLKPSLNQLLLFSSFVRKLLLSFLYVTYNRRILMGSS